MYSFKFLNLFISVLLLLNVNLINGVSKNEFFPYGINDNILSSENEDGSTTEIPLTVPISFYGQLYRGIYVNTNGLISFNTEIPSFYSTQFPLDFPAIAPFYADIDTRGSGTIFYRETQDPAILGRLSDDVREHFTWAREFTATSAFIATWDNVGHYDSKDDKTNSFQVVIASDGQDSYVVVLYADNGIQWIQGDGKVQGLPDARAQAGIMSGDGRIQSFHGSGTEHIRSIDKLSNIGTPGVWMYKIGRFFPGENVLSSDRRSESSVDEAQSCSTGAAFCHINGRCTDYEEGFCCHCSQSFFGNGKSCLENGAPQRMNGKVTGVLNGVVLGELDLHSYIVTADGRSYNAISRAPVSVGYDMQVLSTIGSVVGWMFAVVKGKAINGYQLTGGVFNRTVDVTFPQTGHSVQIKQSLLGLDVFSHLEIRF